METFGDGDSLEVQIKIKERFDVMVVTVGNWSEHKNTRLEAELPSGKDPGRAPKRVRTCARESLAKRYFSMWQHL